MKRDQGGSCSALGPTKPTLRKESAMRKPNWRSAFTSSLLLSLLALASCVVDDRTLHASDSTSGTDAGGDIGTGATPSSTGGSSTTNGGDGGDDGNGVGASPFGGSAGGSCPDLNHDDVPDCEQSLAKNGFFDNNFADWTPEVNIALDWEALDADSNGDSGSMGVQNSNAANLDNLSLSGSSQCIELQGAGLYEVGASIYVDGSQQGKGSGGVNVAFYEASACAGATMIGFGGTSPMVSATDEWKAAGFQADAPMNARSMSLRLVVLKAFKDPPVQVRFDNVVVKPPG